MASPSLSRRGVANHHGPPPSPGAERADPSSVGGGALNGSSHEVHDEGESSTSRTTRDRSGGGVGGQSGGKSGGLSYSKSIVDKERKIGHRRVDDTGQVSYKKIQTNQLMGSIQLGIQNSLGALGRYDERDLLMQDFMTVDTVSFPKHGSQLTPAHTYSDFTFRTMAPLAFRYFLNLFGIKREDFMVSLCTEPLRELSNPGASGSIFYLTNDDEFILKTVQHKEAEFLQKLLPGYYMNLNQNPHTLLPKFFGMYCYQCNQKNIRLTVMNNLLPTNVKMHLKFDLKGSTYKRKANRHERAKKSPTYKDLDITEFLPEGVLLEPETYNALISTLRRDCRVLESFRIMDYSLLIGIHNLDQANREESTSGPTDGSSSSPRPPSASRGGISYHNNSNNQKLILNRTTSAQQKPKLVAHSTAMESIQAQTEPIDEQEHLPPGGIPARNHKGERLLLYLGIIDILQSYRMRKKLEHTFKSIIHDGDTVSVHRPGFYAHRFLDFMADKVFKKIPSLDLPEIKGTHRKFRTLVSSLIGVGQQYQSSALKHSPSRKSKRDSVKKNSIVSAALQGGNAGGAGGNSSDDQADPSQKYKESSGGWNSKERAPAPISAAAVIEAQVSAAQGSQQSHASPTARQKKLMMMMMTEASQQAQQNDDESTQLNPKDSPALLSNSSNLISPTVNTTTNNTDTTTTTAHEKPVPCLEGVDQAYFEPSNLEAMINLPAVLWDRPHGSKMRVPPPSSCVVPRGGDLVAAGAAAPHSSASSSSSSARTVIHRGIAAGYSASTRSSEALSSSPSGAIGGGNSSSLTRPRNRLHEQVKHTSTEISSERLSESRMSEGYGNDQGTPSRLSVGTGSMGGGWNTPTWTEGTPSYTESSYSGDLAGAGGSTPNRNLRASRESIITRNYKDTPYHETEITRL
ncbi:uncharacterized protein LOC131884205 isoform X3 [Tigriopus californicus]|uniref:uncharacterized protein LOC131884205 isoform X3 n=1 Tax=Tigriopus californicus TaxID=6832 RepID=UPI0027DA9B6C|nr:uncharacterized protein LOC131884205 isoform X3 [Tigriopus californicus]